MSKAVLATLSNDAPTALTVEVAPLLSMRGISRHWGRGSGRWAVLRDVDLDVAPRSAICVAGRNGAGKTTLLRIATGILANSGSVTVDGLSTDQSWRDYHRRIGFLSAGDRGLYARVTVQAHLEYWARIAFMPARERGPAVEEALATFGLVDLAKRRADRLSQGQRQRLRLALTLVHRPKLVLLDEPRNSLDGDGVDMLAQAVHRVLERGGSIVWCAPVGEDQPVVFDRTYILEDGGLHPA